MMKILFSAMLLSLPAFAADPAADFSPESAPSASAPPIEETAKTSLSDIGTEPAKKSSDHKECSALKTCEIKQSAHEGKKKSYFTRTLKFDYLCDKDEHSMPLEGGKELVLLIYNHKVLGELFAAGGRKTLLSKRYASLTAEKLSLKYTPGGKAQSVFVECTK